MTDETANTGSAPQAGNVSVSVDGPGSMTAEQSAAVDEFRTLAKDPDFARRFAEGETGAVQQFKAIHERGMKAQPGAQDTPPPSEPPAGQHTDPNYAPHPEADHNVPDTPAGYRFDYTTLHQRGEDPNYAVDLEARELLHAAQIPQDVAARMFELHNVAGFNPPSEATIKHQMIASEAILRRDWGADFDRKVAAARSVLNALPSDKRERAIQFLEASGIGNDPYVIRRFAQIAEHRAAVRR